MTDGVPIRGVFFLPPGVDFPRELARGLNRRLGGRPPDTWARTMLYLNTERMRRRLRDLLCDGTARLLPRMRLIGDLARDPVVAHEGVAASRLATQLELSQLVAAYLERTPGLASPTAAFGLADALLSLAEEMAGEGVAPSALEGLCPDAQATHWQRNLSFLRIAFDFLGESAVRLAEGRQRLAATALAGTWAADPPADPVILAGSTVSRGQTMVLARAIATLPQGAIILPAFDTDLPSALWDTLGEGATPDHPQARNALVLRELGLAAADVAPWTDATTPAPARARMLSLALRPAPVTDAWVDEGPGLEGLALLAETMTLIEAPGPQAEAAAIAVAIRECAEAGKSVALITPDRLLARRVEAILDRWGIRADDSAGRPLHLTPPGTLLAMCAQALGRPMAPGQLIALLKHPLTARDNGRGNHLRHTRDLELGHLRGGPPEVDPAGLAKWADKSADRGGWTAWVAGLVQEVSRADPAPLSDWIDRLTDLAGRLSAGPGGAGSGELWAAEAGQAAQASMDAFTLAAAGHPPVDAGQFMAVLSGVLSAGSVRNPKGAHPAVKILGTLEGRVERPEVAILGGLVEGVWPGLPTPDPWLSRVMRRDAGLLSPERGVGLQAHDFQLSANAPEVVLSLALRDASRPTVPARWLNRITGLLAGLPPNGPDALAAMRARGARLVDLGMAMDAPDADASPAQRPMPVPPSDARPKRLSVTEITRLVTDPYAIYARRVLGLEPLDPLDREADALMRGTVLHKVAEAYVAELRDTGQAPDADRFIAVARQILTDEVPWPAVRNLWIGHLTRNADWFAETERNRQADGAVARLEVKGARRLDASGFELSCKADRIDRRADGTIAIYDYKSGSPPSKSDVTERDRQLALEAAIAATGGFEGLDPAIASKLEYIGLGGEIRDATGIAGADETWTEFEALIAAYLGPETGFSARARLYDKARFGSDFDHLSRFGEWSGSDPFIPEDVG